MWENLFNGKWDKTDFLVTIGLVGLFYVFFDSLKLDVKTKKGKK